MNEEQAEGQPAGERLDALQQDIDEVRRRVADDDLGEELGQEDPSLLDQGERSFMTEGGGEGPGDDTIVPPG